MCWTFDFTFLPDKSLFLNMFSNDINFDNVAFVWFVCVRLVCELYQLVCQHCSCTSAQIVRTPSNAFTSALARVFSKRVIHGIESQHSFNLVAERDKR